MGGKMMTINISLPKSLYNEAKKQVKKYHYASVSELIRDAMRWWLNDKLTRNGFTPEFEEEVLLREKEPLDNDIVWEGKESDLAKYAKSTKTSGVRKGYKRTPKKAIRIRGEGEFTSREIYGKK